MQGIKVFLCRQQIPVSYWDMNESNMHKEVNKQWTFLSRKWATDI